MMKIIATLLVGFALLQSTPVSKKADRELDGYAGAVKKAVEEWSPVSGHRTTIQPGTRCRTNSRLYDVNGRLTQSSYYSGSCGADETRTHYTYDSEDNRTERIEEIIGENSPGPPPPPMPPPGLKEEDRKGLPKTVFKYDSQGRKVEASTTRPSGALIYKLVYKYDEQGRLQESQRFDSDGKTSSKFIYSYEGNKRYPAGYTYIDRAGKPDSEMTYSDYELNGQGDWIKRKGTAVYPDGRKTVSFYYRSIDYYPTKK